MTLIVIHVPCIYSIVIEDQANLCLELITIDMKIHAAAYVGTILLSVY